MYLLMNPAARAGGEEQFFSLLGESSKLFAVHLDFRSRMEGFMKAYASCTFLGAVLTLATAVPGVRISAAADPQVNAGVDRVYVIDCGDGSGTDESRWTPGVNAGVPVGFPGHCYLIHHTQGWFLWDTGVDDAVAQLPNHERVLHEWGPGTGPVWRKPITLAAQLEDIHVMPSDIKLMAVSHSHPDHAGNIEMFASTLMLVQRVEYEWAGSRQDTVAFNKKHPVSSSTETTISLATEASCYSPHPDTRPATNLCS